MTARELWNAFDGYNERREREYRNRWEQTRWIGTIQANSFSNKKISPSEMIKFPWEENVDRSDEIELIKERRKWRTEQ